MENYCQLKDIINDLISKKQNDSEILNALKLLEKEIPSLED